jgi:excinuclease UvrABC helicase subunit UvrB
MFPGVVCERNRDQRRNRAIAVGTTTSLLSRRDIIVASVSCISLGNPGRMGGVINLESGNHRRNNLLRQLGKSV